MGLPATVAQPTLLCGPAVHEMPPYRFGPSSSYAPSLVLAPQQHSPQGLTRQTQALRNATTWWNISSALYYPLVGLPTLSNTTANTAAYPCPPFQLPQQQHPLPPLRAIHNTRCAQVLSSPSEMSSMSADNDASPQCSPAPSFVHVVCNAPLIAPVPLPYHSPTFLQFDLPDDDEDLSHPPYLSRPHKRKREDEEDEEEVSEEPVTMKRRVAGDGSAHWASNAPHSAAYRPSAASHAAPVNSIGSYRHR